MNLKQDRKSTGRPPFARVEKRRLLAAAASATRILVVLIVVGGAGDSIAAPRLRFRRHVDFAPASRNVPTTKLVEPPKHYLAFRAARPLVVDGRLNDEAWQAAPWTDEFVDIEGDKRPRPRFSTRAKMLWDDRYLYIGAQLNEPHVWGTLVEHDSVIFHDNDFEVFLDPDGDNCRYGEFEINVLNTGWDLLLPIPYKDGGSADNGWEIPGLRTAVHVDGTVNDASDVDRGWSVEIAMPWEVLTALQIDPPGRRPADGDTWRVNFSRVEWMHEIVDGKYRKIPNRREDNWVWSPQHVIDMHRPERWGYVQFSTATAGSAESRRVRYRPDGTYPARELLHRIHYAQQAFRKEHQRYAERLDQLALDGLSHPSLVGPITLRAAAVDQYSAHATIRLPDGRVLRGEIRQDARIRFQ